MRGLTLGLMEIARFRQRQQDHWPMTESEVAYDHGLVNGCPRCHKSDCLTRKRTHWQHWSLQQNGQSSHLAMPLVLNLRCERCSLRIGSKRVG